MSETDDRISDFPETEVEVETVTNDAGHRWRGIRFTDPDTGEQWRVWSLEPDGDPAPHRRFEPFPDCGAPDRSVIFAAPGMFGVAHHYPTDPGGLYVNVDANPELEALRGRRFACGEDIESAAAAILAEGFAS